MLKLRNRRYKALTDAEERDEDHDGIPDIYEQHNPEYHLRMARIYEDRAAEHRRKAEDAAAAALQTAAGSTTEGDRPA